MKKKTVSAPRPPSAAPVQPEEVLRQLSESEAAISPPAPAVNPLAQDPQLIQDFLLEAREHLTNIEARLLEIEQGTTSEETINSTFRSFHTIKGLAGFLDFAVLQEVSHEVETLLDRARSGELRLTPQRVDVILAASDYLALWLGQIEASARGQQSPEPQAPDELVARVRQALEESGTQDPAAGPEGSAMEAGEASTEVRQAEGGGARVAASLVKVETGKLEYLVDMVGELVIAQSMLRHNPDLEGVKTPRVQRDITHLARVTAEVQKTAMAMRMVPIGQLFRRMSRLVRDLARKSGKQAELDLFGEDVELDRSIVEEIADPLVHMLRNSMDHGLEGPEERVAAGKPPVGRVRLSAWHQAGQIVIEIRDDGRGLNRERILEKARNRGLIGIDEALSDSEVWQLIFHPGFSTAEKVTDVSGRGVGMDVVRRHVEKLRGRVEIDTTPGAGTVFLVKVPLTLAIIDGLVVHVGEDRFIVPIYSVREIFKPAPESIFTVEGRGEMALVRERLLPVVRLARRLGVPGETAASGEGLMIVGESEGMQFCLQVDRLAGKQEVVIKSLGETFRRVRGIAGGAILGDGRVGLILDMAALRPGAAVHGLE
ncbi:MAG: chemotaxis protein CheA [Bryobacteraceae bacterium]|nr:chemotaxis protein CheA [Solibacteraceae bacterium]MCO5352050.1 chemotaxis protein CheA [Bryobacteraceae bacterium]